MRVFIRLTFFIMLCMLAIAFYGCGGHDADENHDGHDHAAETSGVEAAVHEDHEGHDHDAAVHEEHGEEDHDHDAEGVDHDGHSEADVDEDIHDHEQDTAIEAGNDWEDMIHLETVVASVMPIAMTLTVPGTIIPDQNKVAVVSPFIESSVSRVFVNIGDRVTSNTELACLASPEIGMMRAEYSKAQAEMNIKRQVFDRQQRLMDEDIIPRRVFEEAELELHVAQVDYDYARKRLLAIGLREDELDRDDSCREGVEGASIHVHAPISGVITRRSTHLGQMVDASNELFEIMDLGTVWLKADIFEKDLAKIHIGRRRLIWLWTHRLTDWLRMKLWL